MKRLFIVGVLSVFLSSCAILKPTEVKRFANLDAYKFAYIHSAHTIISGVGGGGGVIGYGTGGGYSYSQSSSTNPADVISGILIKKGFVVVGNITNPKQTFTVKYGQGSRRLNAFEVNIQILDSASQEPLFVCTAEGRDTWGGQETIAIRNALTRCLQDL